MFKTAATKIAHNSTLTALAGNQDLRPLQDVITAEKTVLISLQKLSVDYSKAAEALRAWGLSEGDDLGDILSASTTLLTSFSSALSQYAAHGHVMRDHLKGIRSREEALDELRRRRRAVHRKADDADKKLSKMSPENKNLGTQTELLNRLKDEIRSLDSEIMTEEASMGDFKRSSTRNWMGLKFGGLLECSEKGTIVGEYGKLVIAEIPEEVSQPGMPRSLYYGHGKVESLVNEANRCINEVTLSAVSSASPRDHLPPIPQKEPGYGDDAGNGVWSPPDFRSGPAPINTSSNYLPSPRTGNGQFLDSMDSPVTGGPYSAQTAGFSPRPTNIDQAVDDFGVNSRSGGPFDSPNTGGGRFATFPVKTRQAAPTSPFSLHDPPSLNTKHQLGDSFSLSIAEALDARKGANEGAHPPWHGQRSGEGSSVSPFPSALPQPPPGAQAPELGNPWSSPTQGTAGQPTTLSSHRREISNLSDNDDALLAYMTSVDEEAHSPKPATLSQTPTTAGHQQGWSTQGNEGSDDKHAAAIHQQPPPAQNLPKAEAEAPPRVPSIHAHFEEPSPAAVLVENRMRPSSVEVEVEEAPSTPSSQGLRAIHRVPPPSFNPEEDDRALNAAAAREISRELDNITFDPPSLHDAPEPPSHLEPSQERGRTLTTSNNSDEDSREPSPLAPPSAPFAQRSVSPHPYAELQHTPAQLYAQSYQSSSSYNLNQASPAQVYAQSYQGSAPTNVHDHSLLDPHAPSSTLPPRFQALNQNNQPDPQLVPPRFQPSRTHSPSSPIQQQLPPRFQASQHQSPTLAFSDPQDGRYPSMGGQNPETPYRTPLEYPRGLGPPPTLQNSPSSANNSPSPALPAHGTRTISAAAFKRPPPHKTGSGDNHALGLGKPLDSGIGGQKRLPSSPYPASRLAGEDVGSASPAGISGQPRMSRDLPPPPAFENDDYQYDYISAYANSDQGSPVRSTFDQSPRGSGQYTQPTGGHGYGGGKFATDLEGGSLR